MKKFLTILSILGCSLFASAQCAVMISADSTGAGLILTANTLNNMAVSFEWNNGETTQSISADPNTFDYCVIATYADGCVAEDCYGDFPQGACNVYIQSVQNGQWLQAFANGEAPYNFQWSNGSTDSSIPISSNDTLLCVTMTDVTGCTATSCYDIAPNCSVSISEEPTPIGATALVANATANGQVEYYWNTGETTQSIIPNGTGNYCVDIYAGSGQDSCYASTCYYYSDPNACYVYIYQDTVQFGDSEVELYTGINGGNAPYTFEWSTGEDTETITVTENGQYCVTITGANGCVDTDCIYANIPQCIVSISEETDSAGNISLVADGAGNGNIDYFWNTGETTQSIMPNGSGNYCVSIFINSNSQDSCFANACYYFDDPNECFVNIYQVDSTQTSGSEITLIAATTGNGNFTYEWSTGETTEEIEVSENGDYCVTVTSTLGCIASNCYYFYPDSVDCSVTIEEEITPSGNVFLVATATGSGTFSYQWSTGETTQSIIPNGSGTYWVILTTGSSPNNGCTAFVNYFYNDPNDCSVNIMQVDSAIVGTTSVTLQANASPLGTYTYEWSTGETTSEIETSGNGTYCVTVTNSDGCSATDCHFFFVLDCHVTISEEIDANGVTSLVANGEGVEPFTYIWNTGETTQSIIPDGSGFYSVIMNAGSSLNDTCTTSDTYIYSDPADCSVYISPSDSMQIGVPVTSLTAYTIGNGNFTYEWSTGETTQEIEISEDGDYCVTVTSSLGCVETACYYYEYQACGGEIDASGSNTTSIDMCAVSIAGVAPFTYLWSTGETTECINTNVTGTYSVTITDSEGCVAEVCCLTFQFLPPNYNLNGTVFLADSLSGNGNIQGWAYRIGINPDGTASLIDSTELFSNPNSWGAYYDFGEVDAGEYIVKAALTEDSDGYETNLPTYHYSSLTWGEAEVITVPTNGFPTYNIQMIEGNNPGGPGGIYGSVIVGDGLLVDPIPNTSILLFDESENPMQHVLTDANGEFAFPSLPYGTYKVQVEIVGLAPAWYWVTIGPDNPTANGLTFEVNEFGITTDIEEVVAVETFHVFPNPVAEKLTINFSANRNSDVQISLTSITGQTVLVDNQQLSTGAQSIEMNVTNIPTGIYFLNIRDGKDVVSKKIVKK